MSNQLGDAVSPYLLQHKDNPVHWHEWSGEALAEAKRRDCPILLSVGYAACHWCHVMAHESFEDDGVAEVMNTLFVNVKVDREERPDIDHLYMSALHALGEQGTVPEITPYASDVAEARGIAARIARLVEEGTPAEDVAVLYRVNVQAAAL